MRLIFSELGDSQSSQEAQESTRQCGPKGNNNENEYASSTSGFSRRNGGKIQGKPAIREENNDETDDEEDGLENENGRTTPSLKGSLTDIFDDVSSPSSSIIDSPSSDDHGGLTEDSWHPPSTHGSHRKDLKGVDEGTDPSEPTEYSTSEIDLYQEDKESSKDGLSQLDSSSPAAEPTSSGSKADRNRKRKSNSDRNHLNPSGNTSSKRQKSMSSGVNPDESVSSRKKRDRNFDLERLESFDGSEASDATRCFPDFESDTCRNSGSLTECENESVLSPKSIGNKFQRNKNRTNSSTTDDGDESSNDSESMLLQPRMKDVDPRSSTPRNNLEYVDGAVGEIEKSSSLRIKNAKSIPLEMYNAEDCSFSILNEQTDEEGTLVKDSRNNKRGPLKKTSEVRKDPDHEMERESTVTNQQRVGSKIDQSNLHNRERRRSEAQTESESYLANVLQDICSYPGEGKSPTVPAVTTKGKSKDSGSSVGGERLTQEPQSGLASKSGGSQEPSKMKKRRRLKLRKSDESSNRTAVCASPSEAKTGDSITASQETPGSSRKGRAKASPSKKNLKALADSDVLQPRISSFFPGPKDEGALKSIEEVREVLVVGQSESAHDVREIEKTLPSQHCGRKDLMNEEEGDFLSHVETASSQSINTGVTHRKSAGRSKPQKTHDQQPISAGERRSSSDANNTQKEIVTGDVGHKTIPVPQASGSGDQSTGNQQTSVQGGPVERNVRVTASNSSSPALTETGHSSRTQSASDHLSGQESESIFLFFGLDCPLEHVEEEIVVAMQPVARREQVVMWDQLPQRCCLSLSLMPYFVQDLVKELQ